MTLDEFRSLVESGGPVQRDGRDWRGRCPAHQDDGSRGDLAFREENGRLLVKCWGGCDTKKIVAALGLTLKDLFVGNNGYGGNGHRQKHLESKPDRIRTLHPSAEAAASAIAARLGGTFTNAWTYHHMDGSEAFQVLRFDGCETCDDKKTYRPIHRDGAGYAEGDPSGLLPLYGLPGLLADTTSTVFLGEGEKAADAARLIGLLATTSAHGAQSPSRTDWTPLAGREVAILPDNDEAGRDYAKKVTGILLGLNPPARVKVVTLPGLPPAGDAYDWIEERDDSQPTALRRSWLSLTKPRLKCQAFATIPRQSPQKSWYTTPRRGLRRSRPSRIRSLRTPSIAETRPL